MCLFTVHGGSNRNDWIPRAKRVNRFIPSGCSATIDMNRLVQVITRSHHCYHRLWAGPISILLYTMNSYHHCVTAWSMKRAIRHLRSQSNSRSGWPILFYPFHYPNFLKSELCSWSDSVPSVIGWLLPGEQVAMYRIVQRQNQRQMLKYREER